MRGFALTVHCPRCGTAKPMGAEVAPIVTCVKCGLGFDPKPREQPPREPEPEPEPEPVALVPVAPSEITEQVTANDVHLVIRDSLVGGLGLALLAIVFVIVGFTALSHGQWAYLALAVGIAPAALYGGISRVLGRTYLYLTHDAISVWQEPLPRFRERLLIGDIASLSIEPQKDATGARRFDVIAKTTEGSRTLVNLHKEAATELVAAIRKHRARLGAPVRDEVDQAATRVDKRDT